MTHLSPTRLENCASNIATMVHLPKSQDTKLGAIIKSTRMKPKQTLISNAKEPQPNSVQKQTETLTQEFTFATHNAISANRGGQISANHRWPSSQSKVSEDTNM